MSLYDVIQKVAIDLENSMHINAMWLEGSWVTGKNTGDSDIDVWLDVDDGTFDLAITAFRKVLQKVGHIDWGTSRGLYSTNPKLFKQKFHLDGFPELQRIELDLQEHSRHFLFDKNEHKIEILFDKNNTIKWQSH